MSYRNLFILLVAISFLGCKDQTKPETPSVNETAASAKAAGQALGEFSPVFKMLYLRNFDTSISRNQVNMLFAELGNKDKLIFQFFHTSDNQLTLALYKGDKKHSDFTPLTSVPVLEIAGSEPTQKIDIKNKGVFFADQDLSHKEPGPKPDRDQLRKLQDAASQPGRDYITFTPRLAPSPIANQFYIIYDLGYLSKADFASNNKLLLREPTSIDITMNPSPPRNGGGN